MKYLEDSGRGGGNVAIDAARVSARCGSESVTMVLLEQPDEMPALPEEILTQEDGVSIKMVGDLLYYG